MDTTRIRPATNDDADFLAWVMLTAARSHLSRGLWDITLNRREEDCLSFLRELALTETRSWGHYSRFIVAETDGQAAAALCGYDPIEADASTLAIAIDEAARRVGWSETDVSDMWERFAPVGTCISDDMEGAWIIENVATLPAYRRRGLVNRLLENELKNGRDRGHRLAQISILIGNTPAQRAYEKIGFLPDKEKRHPDYEAAVGAPGMIRLLRNL
jgi:ribosomal protein S18 acetylase RimI-like enzyme